MSERAKSAAMSALGRGDLAGALTSLLALWERHPDATLAEVIGALGRIAGEAVAPLGGRTRAERQRRWLERAAERRAEDLSLLLEELPRASKDERTQRLLALGDWPEDPRLLEAFASHAGGGGDRRQYGIALTQLAHGRPALLWRAPLENWLGRLHGSQSDLRHFGRMALLSLSDAHAPLALEWGPLREALARFGQSPADRLYAELQEDPANLGLRLVYADALLESARPEDVARAEFIQLQVAALERGLGRRERSRMNALRAQHETQWLGGIARHLLRRTLRFQGGFVSEVTMNSMLQGAHWQEVVEGRDRLLAVELLDMRGLEHDLRPLFDRPRPLLAELRMVSVYQMRGLEAVAERLPGLRRVHLWCGYGEWQTDMQALGAWLSEGALPRQLDLLRLSLREVTDEATLKALARLPRDAGPRRVALGDGSLLRNVDRAK